MNKKRAIQEILKVLDHAREHPLRVGQFFAGVVYFKCLNAWDHGRIDIEASEGAVPRGQMKNLVDVVAKRNYGQAEIEEYFRALDDWFAGNIKKSNVLVERRDLYAAIVPPVKIPKFLYRGLRDLKRRPKKGQTVVYGIGKPFIHLSESETMAKEFADEWSWEGNEGCVLKFPKSEIDNQIIFSWPHEHKDPRSAKDIFSLFGVGLFGGEMEWGLFIRKPMRPTKWYLRKTK